jgi:heme exporter protein B
VLAPLGLGSEKEMLQAAAPGLIWIAALLATLLGLERVIEPDLQDGTLDLLRLSALPLELVVLAKVAAQWLTNGLVICLLAPLVAPMLYVEGQTLPVLAASLLIGTPGLSFVGMAGAAISAGVRRGGILLALIVLPLNIPALIFGAGAVSAVQHGADPMQALLLLGAYSLIAAVVGSLAAAAALRLNED